ncbi:hypothetical protein OC835_000519 [Tilletia horrida]|nr:hypothetical protein OC835_000519 [Tilletia horrida]
MLLLQDKLAQSNEDLDMSSMPSPRPDEGFFHSVVQEPCAPARPQHSHQRSEPLSTKTILRACDIPSRSSSITSLSDTYRRQHARQWGARPRSDREPQRPPGINDENQIPYSLGVSSPNRRDSEVTVRQSDQPATKTWPSIASFSSSTSLCSITSSSCASSPSPSPSNAKEYRHAKSGKAPTASSQATAAVLLLQSPVQHRPSSKRTFNQTEWNPKRPGTPPTWATSDPFAQFRPAGEANGEGLAGMDIADVLSGGPVHGGVSGIGVWADDASSGPAAKAGMQSTAHSLKVGGMVAPAGQLGGNFGLFPDPPHMIHPIPTLSPAAFSQLLAPRQRANGASAIPGPRKSPANEQQLQLQQLGQPFHPSGEPEPAVRTGKSKKNRKSADGPASKGAIASTSGSANTESTPSRMRMPSHTSLLLGLSLGPAFGDEDSSSLLLPASGAAASNSIALPGGQLGEAQVPSPNGGSRKGGKKRGSRCASIERTKVTKAARLPLGGSPSFGLNIMGLGDALELDSAYIYLEKDAACQSPVPCIVVTPPPVTVAHTPSRLARSESKPGHTLALTMSGLETLTEDLGSKLAPAPIMTDSPSVRSISSSQTITGAKTGEGLTSVSEMPASASAFADPPVISPPRSISPPPTARAGCTPGEWGRQQQSFASPPDIDPVVIPVIQTRMAEDQAAFTELALEIDVILSEYIYINSPTQAWIVGRRLTTLLLNAIHGNGLAKAPPTLRKMRQVENEVLPEAWLQTESERLLEKVLDHVVTGILVVLADAPVQSHHSADIDIPCLSPYGGMVSGQPSPPTDHLSSRDVGVLFEEIVLANIRDILQKGEEVRDRAHRLEVPLARKGNKRKWELASSERLRAAADQQKNRKLAAKGLISGDEFVKLERKRAAKGNVRDQFADISVLRFVGELFRVSFIGLADVQAWLERMLFDTVYPGVPSIYELGCACALITIVGPQLEAIADKEDRRAYEAAATKAPSSRILAVPETPIRSAGPQGLSKQSWTRPFPLPLRADAPANHWIQCSPAAAIRSPTSPFSSSSISTRTVSCGSGKLSLSSFGSLHSVQSSCSSNWSGSVPALSPPPSAKSEVGDARLTVTSCMERLEELLKQDDMDACVKEIITSVLGLHARGWIANPIPYTPTRFAI